MASDCRARFTTLATSIARCTDAPNQWRFSNKSPALATVGGVGATEWAVSRERGAGGLPPGLGGFGGLAAFKPACAAPAGVRAAEHTSVLCQAPPPGSRGRLPRTRGGVQP